VFIGFVTNFIKLFCFVDLLYFCGNIVQFELQIMPWLRRLVAGFSSQRNVFAPGPVHVGFVVARVTLGPIFLRVIRLSPVNIRP
jgi:hypothetical protein